MALVILRSRPFRETYKIVQPLVISSDRSPHYYEAVRYDRSFGMTKGPYLKLVYWHSYKNISGLEPGDIVELDVTRLVRYWSSHSATIASRPNMRKLGSS